MADILVVKFSEWSYLLCYSSCPCLRILDRLSICYLVVEIVQRPFLLVT